MAASMPGRSTFTATWRVPMPLAGSGLSTARWTWAIEALAIGSRSIDVEFREFVGNVHRQQVAPRGERLAELHENGTEILQRQPKPHGTRRGKIAAERSEAQELLQPRAFEIRKRNFVEAEAVDRDENARQAQRTQHRQPFSRRSRRLPNRSTASRKAATSVPKRSASARVVSNGFSVAK